MLLIDNIKIKRKLPVNVLPRDKHAYQNIAYTEVEEVCLFNLSNVVVLPNSIVIDGFSIIDTLLMKNDSGQIGKLNWKGVIGALLRSKKDVLKKERFILFHNLYSYSYYHWLLEALPRLLILLRHTEDVVLLLPENHNQNFHIESLDLFGNLKLQYLSSEKIYKVERLLTCSQPRIANYHPVLIKELSSFLKDKSKSRKNCGPYIYVTRKNSKKRTILNEDEIIDVLIRYGFQIVDFEQYSFEDQISIMSNAKVCVGLHGAGLANMIFMPSKSKIFELRMFDKGENYFFYSLSDLCEHQFYYQYSKVFKGSNVQDADIFVDINTFENNIISILGV